MEYAGYDYELFKEMKAKDEEEKKLPAPDKVLKIAEYGGMDVKVVVPGRKSYAPKQDLTKPEKAVRLMNARK